MFIIGVPIDISNEYLHYEGDNHCEDFEDRLVDNAQASNDDQDKEVQLTTYGEEINGNISKKY